MKHRVYENKYLAALKIIKRPGDRRGCKSGGRPSQWMWRAGRCRRRRCGRQTAWTVHALDRPSPAPVRRPSVCCSSEDWPGTHSRCQPLLLLPPAAAATTAAGLGLESRASLNHHGTTTMMKTLYQDVCELLNTHAIRRICLADTHRGVSLPVIMHTVQFLINY